MVPLWCFVDGAVNIDRGEETDNVDRGDYCASVLGFHSVGVVFSSPDLV